MTSQSSSRAIVVLSSLGHLYVHVCTAFFFVIVLALEDVWRMPYAELIQLWTLGALMVGAAALPAGMLADRIGAPRVMIAFFVGMGGSAILAGFTTTPLGLMLCLTGIGVFASIYHPVGIPWLVRNAGGKRGKALGFNGIFGSLGAASASIMAGALIDLINWRAAFIVPGVICAATGIVMWWMYARGNISDNATGEDHHQRQDRRDVVRVYAILLVTMFLAGMIFQTTQTALPKMFEVRHNGLIGQSAFGVGVLVAIVYTAAGVMQIIGGHLADRYPLKNVYVAALLVQAPLLWLAASLGGVPLVLVAAFMVMANVAQLPAENMLLARYTPARHHGLAFGVKFVLAFGVAPLAVQFVAFVHRNTGEFFWVFSVLAFLAACAWLAAMFLPADRLAAPIVSTDGGTAARG